MDNSVRFRWHGSSEISSSDLLRDCGQKLTDRALWAMFQERFQRSIFKYLLRALHFHSRNSDVRELVADLGQEVYVRLVRNNGNMLRSFRGETDLSVMAFLGRICTSVVADHLRREGTDKRFGDNVVSLEDAKEMIEASRQKRDDLDMGSILSWIDIEKIVDGDPDHKNAQRNALIFKLHYIDGLTTEEIAGYPGFDLSGSGVETVLVRLRKRIKR